jgi:signal transduction histidine kinase
MMTARRKLNILLVDDQPAKLLTYETMLSELNENLVKAQTAREALAHLLKEDVAVVLMDVNMPELDGFELATMIREHPRCKKTAIIFVSAVHLTDLDRVKGYATGAVDYVSVPVVPEILRAKIGVFLDLYRKTAELEGLNRTLEEHVSERTAELQDTIAQLRESENRLRLQSEALAEADRRKNEFLAMLAHELRNPLQPIRSAVELLRQTRATLEQLQWGRDVIDRQVNQLVRLVDDLLDASRISSGKLELRKDVIDVLPIINSALESTRPLAERKRHHIEVKVPSAPVVLDGDAVRLTQVFLNLLNNAIKYTPPGGHIVVAVEGRDDGVVVRVRDDGIGIVESDLARIFEMFYQGKTPNDDAQGGLGLGLALVRQLVQLHGGTVQASSAGLDLGSEFVVRLPTLSKSRPAPRPLAALKSEPVPAATRRILVVDDNRDAAETLAAMLRLEGNEVDTAFDGEGAISASAEFQPDIILMDLGMPKLDGYDAARAIRRDARGLEVVLIAITGWGGDVDRQMSREAGFDRHLVKPVVPTELLAILSSLEPRRRALN